MTATPNKGWRSGDKFTPIYGLVFLPLIARFWAWWLVPDWNWFLIDLALFALSALIFVGIALVNLIRLRWKRVLSLSLAAGAIAAIGFALNAVGMTPDRLRFALTGNEYIRAVEQIAGTAGTPRFKTFPWDDTFTGKTYRTLVYDESDEITHPVGTQSEDWRKRATEGCGKNGNCIHLESKPPDEYVSVETLRDHFFILDDEYPNAFP